MAERWTPAFQVDDLPGGCRLTLVGLACGQGATLQEAADDLIARLLTLVICARASGLRAPPELGPPDHRLLEFVWELSELAARGEDIRERVFGAIPRAA
jgi:hypothetical protein